MIELAYVKAVLETIDFENTDEVLTASYMVKNLVRNQRSASHRRVQLGLVKRHVAQSNRCDASRVGSQRRRQPADVVAWGL